ncbi:MAG: DUF2318 domain-containing protein [Nitrospirae bacterium]|nr:DUF2318 domain-containing protein [Nitrospirota bacterium]
MSKDKKKTFVVEPKKNNKLIAIVIGILVISAVGFILLSGSGDRVTPVNAEAGIVKIPVADVSDGKARFFSLNGIRFFVLKSSDGVLRTAFDACDVCFREKKGYRQEGDLMVCNNCGQAFPSEKINELRGGCNPIPVERQVQGKYLMLSEEDIKVGAGYF